MHSIEKPLLQTFLEQEQLPESFVDTISQWYLPLAQRLLAQRLQWSPPLLVGINGAQGTGKSTLASLLTLVLRHQDLNVVNMSIDDFYLSHDARAKLARQVHPLLATRGVPGTHDLELLDDSLALLTKSDAQHAIRLPRFDKAKDDPVPRQDWERVKQPVDVILLEGWFVGVAPQREDELLIAVNELEAREDGTGTWRRYVNQSLANYQSLFQQLDFLLMLKAPSFDCVYQWRSLQEKKLATRTRDPESRIMDEPTLRRFIQHFERLTRHGLASLPPKADLVFHLDRDHQIVKGA